MQDFYLNLKGVSVHTRMRVCVCVCVCVSLFVCLFVCVYIYIYIYTKRHVSVCYRTKKVKDVVVMYWGIFYSGMILTVHTVASSRALKLTIPNDL